MKRILSLLIAAVMLTACLTAFAESASPALQEDVVVLFTSDVHCGVEDYWGYAGLAAVRDYFAKENHVLLVDNGDAIQGAPVGTMTTGSAIIDIMNAIGFDSITIGNHEFDYGMDRFLEIAKTMTKTPYISCNFTYRGEKVFDPYVIREFDGVKIAFVGVTTPETFTSSTPSYFQDENGNYIYGFCEGNNGQDLYDAVQEAVDAARAEGADYVFLQAHLGIEATASPWTSNEVIANTTGIDVVLDGHSHSVIDPRNTVTTEDGTVLNESEVRNRNGEKVMLIACGTKLAYIGAVTISAKDGSISGRLYGWDFADNATTVFGLTGYAVDAVNAATAKMKEKLATVVAHSDVDLHVFEKAGDKKRTRLIRNQETNLGDLVADAYRDQAGNTDIAFVNGGGIRVDIKAGDITLNDILSVHPFGNNLTVVEATGSQILDYLEWNSRNMPDEAGGFAQVSGLTYEINTAIPSSVQKDEHGQFAGVTGEYRVRNVTVGGEPLDPSKTYTVASNDYILLSAGDGNNMFLGDTVLQNAVKIDNQVLIDYITGTLGGSVGSDYAEPQGRITIVN